MANIMRMFVLTVLVASSLAAKYSLTTTQFYYTSKSPDIRLSCNQTAWNNQTIVAFFQGDKPIFNSSKPIKEFPMVVGVDGNTKILLNQTIKTGWVDLSCSVNNTKSDNKLTIPFVDGFSFAHPAKFELKKNHTLECKGSILPKVDLTAEFSLNKKRFAMLLNSKLTRDPVYQSMNVTQVDKSNNSITIMANDSDTNGTFTCALLFTYKSNTQQRVESEGWSTKNGIQSTMIASFFVILLTAFSNAFINIFN